VDENIQNWIKDLSRITWTETEIYTAVKTERAPRPQQALRDK